MKYTMKDGTLRLEGEVLPISSRTVGLAMVLLATDSRELEIPADVAEGIIRIERARALRLLETEVMRKGIA